MLLGCKARLIMVSWKSTHSWYITNPYGSCFITLVFHKQYIKGNITKVCVLYCFILQRFTGIEWLHLFANISGSMERSRNEVAWQICGRAVMFDPYQVGAPTPIMHELQLKTNHLISNISRMFTINPSARKHQTYVKKTETKNNW